MLDMYDYFVLYFIVYAATVTAMTTVLGIFFQKGMKKLKLVIENDIPHMVDSSTDKIIKKTFNKLDSINMHNAKAGKKAGEQSIGLGDIAMGFLGSKMGQDMIGSLLGGFVKPKLPGPQGPQPPQM